MEIVAVGGYEEVGRNMTVVKYGNDAIVVDMGIRLDRVLIHEDTDISKLPPEELARRGIIPSVGDDYGEVKAIVLTHAHLDHLGAVPILAEKFPLAPIIGTPYTIELVKQELRGKRRNPLYVLEAGEVLQVAPRLSIEFVRITHSIPDCVVLVVHTPEGSLAYFNDFKLDDTPVIGEKPDYQRISELGKEGLKALIIETTRVANDGRTPSEQVARTLLEDTLLKSSPEHGLIVTTFSSHIARIKSILDIAERLGREPLLLGRSMEKYVSIAERKGIISLPENAHIYGGKDAIKKALKRAARERERYMLIITGHQGEQDALLTRIANKKFEYRIAPGDEVVFSADVIPNPINVAQRYALETKLKMQGARLFKGLHVSGHASREDHYDLLKMLQPEKIIPTHGTLDMLAMYAELAETLGYAINREVFLLRNGQRLEV
ncbi:MAG: RNase J family beta-CASP ribonuclease [Euryarchaeota archaeon]|nr:RNase J family beta-CASP ribonuclease [Euryarchaeota archaeon]